MAIYTKRAGTWTQVTRPYVKRDGVWTPVNAVYQKISGQWKQVFVWDITPPPAPIVTIDIVPTTSGRYINITTATSGAAASSVALTRILVSRTGYPATQYGGTYYSYPGKEAPNEPWSDNLYGTGYHPSPSTPVTKHWPPNAWQNANIPAGPFYVQAWNQDVNGNWSVGGYASVNVPKTGAGTNILTRSARFTPNATGSYVEGKGFAFGDLVQATTPQKSVGLLFYGGQFVAELGRYLPKVTITRAQIYLKRSDTDGSPTANVSLWHHGYNSTSEVTSYVLEPSQAAETTFLGTLAKGEGKWFDLPTSFYNDLVSGTQRGFGLTWRKPNTAAATAADYSILAGSTEADIRPGELALVWTEAP